MNDEAGFLNAILANPWDEVTRAIYADWLEERGDPRAEYLRVESAVISLAFKAPRGQQARGIAETLLATYRALRANLDPDWLASTARPDWILVKGSSPKAIEECIVGSSGLWELKQPREHQVQIHALGRSRFSVRFSPTLAPFFLCDLLGWLADPNYNRGVNSVSGWLTSPHTGIRYYFTVPEEHVGSEFVSGYAVGGRPVVFDRSSGAVNPGERNCRAVREPHWLPASTPPKRTCTYISDLDPTSSPTFLDL